MSPGAAAVTVPEMIALLEAGGQVLAANQRLARTLELDYAAHQQGKGRSAWPTPAISTPDAFFAARQRALGREVLLAPAQERLVWADILSADVDAENPLLDVAATAQLAASAWRLAQEWNLPLDGPDWSESEETVAFARWARAFARRCRERGWTTVAELAGSDELRDEGAWPSAVGLAGFDRRTPQFEAWLERAQRGGTTVMDFVPVGEAAEVRVEPAEDAESELAAAAAWARGLIDAGEAGPIGVVVADLKARRAAAERAFARALHPNLAPGDTAPRAYRLSLGPSLAEHAVTGAALRLLELVAGDRLLAMDEASVVLLSPFLGGAEAARGSRVALDLELRSKGRAQMRPAELQLPAWNGNSAPYSVWAERCAAALEAMGWPGERGLSSDEHQTVQSWQLLLDELAGLDAVAPRAVTSEEALRQLRQMAQGRPFQPRSRRVPAVHVLGWLEASGQRFTHLWIAGLDDRTLPAPAAPHVLLPAAPQRAREVPGATAADQAAFAQTVWRRLCCSAGTVVASFARHEGDTELRPSPLLPSAGAAAATIAADVAAAVAWERFDDDTAPPVGAERRRAGSSMFTEQAQCPFRAFAHRRLRAAAPVAAVAGIPRTVWGQILHDALRRWRCGQPAATPVEAARAAVAAQSLLHGRPALSRMVAAAIAAQIEEWQTKEADRAPFKTIACEQERSVQFAEWDLELRVDRVDELGDGNRLLLDYKSSGTSKGDWNLERFRAPQLPLYLVTDDNAEKVAAIAFAQLTPGDMSLKAAARSKGLITRAEVPKEGWGAQVEAWRDKLKKLASDHAAGWAEVEPLDAKVCETCDLHGLCRIGDWPAYRKLPTAEEDSDAG